jgi:hypothetical protein
MHIAAVEDTAKATSSLNMRSSVPTLCEQNQLVTGNGLNLFADRLCK